MQKYVKGKGKNHLSFKSRFWRTQQKSKTSCIVKIKEYGTQFDVKNKSWTKNGPNGKVN